MYTKEHVELSKLPIFKAYECIYPDQYQDFDIDWWTVSELKTIFNIKLTEIEKKTRIQAYKSGVGYRGFAAVYSRQEILALRLLANLEA